MTNSKDDIFPEKSDRFFLKMIESFPIGILLFNSQGRITYLNNNFLEFCVYHQLEINPSNTINIFEEDLFYGNHLLEYFQRVREGYSFEKEIEGLRTFNLRKIAIVVKAVPLFTENKFDGGMIILQDIKVGHEEEKPLENIEPRWEEILNSSVDLLLITDSDGNIKFSFGKRSKKFLSRISPFEQNNINSLFSNEVNNLIKNEIILVKESLSKQKFNLVLSINNRPHDYECEIEPILDDDKKIKLLFFHFNDIRNFTKAQKALELKIQDLMKHKIYLENITTPIFSVDMNGKILYWNKSSQDVFGYSEFQASGKYFIRLIGITEPNYFDEIKNQLDKSSQVDKIFKIISINGKEETLTASFNLVDNEDPYIVISCQSITDKIRLETKIKIAENRFNNVIQNSGNIIFNLDSKGKFTFANNAFLELTEIAETELLKIGLRELIEPEFFLTIHLKNYHRNPKAEKKLKFH